MINSIGEELESWSDIFQTIIWKNVVYQNLKHVSKNDLFSKIFALLREQRTFNFNEFFLFLLFFVCLNHVEWMEQISEMNIM